MVETKKEEVVKSTEQTTSTTTAPKKKSNTLLYIIIGFVVFLTVLAVATFFVVRGLVKKGVDSLEEGQEWVEQIAEESEVEEGENGETWLYKKSTEEKVDGELEKENLINKNFPDDIPLPGGIVTASSYSSDYSVDVEIDINSTVEEILDWYENALEEDGWVITSRSSQEDVEGWVSGRLEFEPEDGERRFRISLDTNPYQDFTSITITEYFY